MWAENLRGVDSVTNGEAVPNLRMSKKLGRSCGFGNSRFAFTPIGDNRFIQGIYQKRVTGYNQTGRIAGRPRESYIVRMKSYRPTNPQTKTQQDWRVIFADAVENWRLLTDEEKQPYNTRGIKMSKPGRSLFISEYLKARRFQ